MIILQNVEDINKEILRLTECKRLMKIKHLEELARLESQLTIKEAEYTVVTGRKYLVEDYWPGV